MSIISVSQKLDISIKVSTVNQEVFPFLSVLLKLEYNTEDPYSPAVLFLILKKHNLISDIINLLLLENAGLIY